MSDAAAKALDLFTADIEQIVAGTAGTRVVAPLA